MNALVRRYLRKWDAELDSIKHNCPEVQKQELKEILQSPLILRFHTDLNLENFSNYPLTSYSDYTNKIKALKKSKSSPKYFAQSSGTSGTKKLIPVSETFVKRNHQRGSWYQLHTLYLHNPKMNVFRAKNLLIGGSLYEFDKRNIIGDVSGIMISRIPWYMRPWYVPKIKEAIQPDWAAKLTISAVRAAETTNMSLLAGTPTWVLTVLRETLTKTKSKKISDLWPDLKAYVHGGVNFEPYRSQFEALIDIPKFRYIEVYNATEGFFAYQDRPYERGMLLMCASGVYFEFIELNTYRNGNFKILNIADVQQGISYVLLITTSCGLVRYIQGDVINFITIAPYRISVVGRIGAYINAFGEDLMLEEAQEALLTTTENYNCTISQFTIAPKYISIDEKGRHEWYIEFEKTPIEMRAFEKELDLSLQKINHNYKQKRAGDIAMGCLRIINMPRGTTLRFLKGKGKISGQTKLPRMRNDRSIADALQVYL